MHVRWCLLDGESQHLQQILEIDVASMQAYQGLGRTSFLGPALQGYLIMSFGSFVEYNVAEYL